MAIKQLSVFVENEKGKLSEITELIAGAGVDMRAMSIADTSEFGILRLIVKEPGKVKELLEQGGFISTLNDVIGVEINDKPGGLAQIISMFAANGINMEYMYAFLTRIEGKAYLVVRVDDTPAVEKLLAQNNIHMLSEADIDKM